MTTHDRDKIIAAAKEAGIYSVFLGGQMVSTESIERLYAIAFESGAASRDAEIAYLQSRIDEFMLEYCPDEMTKEQLDSWAKHQRAIQENELPESLRKP